MNRLFVREITDIRFTFSPQSKAAQLTAKLKHEAMLQAMEVAENTFKDSGSLTGEIQFKFPRKRLPRRVKEPLEVILTWEIIR